MYVPAERFVQINWRKSTMRSYRTLLPSLDCILPAKCSVGTLLMNLLILLLLWTVHFLRWVGFVALYIFYKFIQTESPIIENW